MPSLLGFRRCTCSPAGFQVPAFLTSISRTEPSFALCSLRVEPALLLPLVGSRERAIVLGFRAPFLFTKKEKPEIQTDSIQSGFRSDLFYSRRASVLIVKNSTTWQQLSGAAQSCQVRCRRAKLADHRQGSNALSRSGTSADLSLGVQRQVRMLDPSFVVATKNSLWHS